MHQLPVEVLLQICLWLSVRDILALRQLNHYFHDFTKTSNIWLSLLHRLKLALPPGQPIIPYASDRLSIEYFISRSMRFQQNWRWNRNPLPKRYKFDVPYPTVAMVFLPGGNHMVSVHEEERGKARNTIIVWDMSFQGKRRHVAIALIRSHTSVDRLQARYALVEGHISLVIAYVRPSVEGRTVVVAMFAHLALLNEISRLGPGTPACEEFMKLNPDPFRSLLESSTRYPIGAISLSEIGGLPFLAVVRRPRTIVFYDLVSETRSVLKLQVSTDLGWRHSIWSIKILPSQKQIFVVRILIANPDDLMDLLSDNLVVFELYHLPSHVIDDEEAINNNSGPLAYPVQYQYIMDHDVESCYISDGDTSWNFRTHPDPDIPMLHMLSQTSPPPPLSVFVITKERRGFIHYLSRPKEDADTGYHYGLPVARTICHWELPETCVVLPGGYHSIAITRPAFHHPSEGISVLQLCSYRTEDYEFSAPEDNGYRKPAQAERSSDSAGSMQDDSEVSVRKPDQAMMKHPVIPGDLALSMRKGTRCLQFDEWLGRLLIATADNPCAIHVLDWSI